MGAFELVVCKPQATPKAEPFALIVSSQRAVGHAKWENVHANTLLAALKGGIDDVIDFIDCLIGHGKATDRATAAMDLNVRPRPAER